MKWRIETYTGECFNISSTADAINVLIALNGNAQAYVKEGKYSKADSFILEVNIACGIEVVAESNITPYCGKAIFPLYEKSCAYITQGIPAPNIVMEVKKIIDKIKRNK